MVLNIPTNKESGMGVRIFSTSVRAERVEARFFSMPQEESETLRQAQGERMGSEALD
jgi:hypothetical protein